MNIGSVEWVLGSQSGLNTPSTDIYTGVALNGVTTIWSNPFRQGCATSFGCMVLCQGSNPVVQVQLEESFYDLGLNSASKNSSNTNYIIPDAFPDIFPQISDTNWHLPVEPLTPIPMTFGRFKINGLSGNGANTTVVIVLFRQEPGRFL